MLAFIRLLKVQLVSDAADEFWSPSEMSVGSQSEDTYDRRHHKRCSAPVVVYNSADQDCHQDIVGMSLQTSTAMPSDLVESNKASFFKCATFR